MTTEQARERATANFKSGMNCTQAVASVFAEELGFDADMIQSLAQPFGGGICRMREVCGTVSGMMLSLGMYNSKTRKTGAKSEEIAQNGQNALTWQITANSEKTQKDNTYTIGQKFAEEFRATNGSIICRELLGLVPLGTSEKLLKAGKADSHEASEPVSEERTPEYYKKRPCAELCGIAAEIFQKFLDEQSVRDWNTAEGVRERPQGADEWSDSGSVESPTREAGNAL